MDTNSFTLRVRVPAKVNLALHVGPRREDGYHELSTVFCSLDLYDELYASARSDGGIVLTLAGDDIDQLTTNGDNLAIKAAELIRQRYGNPHMGIDLHLVKRIPIAAGMAGGSADAAAALIACSRLWNLDLDDEQMRLLAADLGSDVAFMVQAGLAHGRGRGEQLNALSTTTRLHWLLLKARRGLSTAEVFSRFDQMVESGLIEPDTNDPIALIDSLQANEPAENLAPYCVNSLEKAAINLYPSLGDHLDFGIRSGALAAIISGSGPTCALLYPTAAEAQRHMAQARLLADVAHVFTASGPTPAPFVEYEWGDE